MAYSGEKDVQKQAADIMEKALEEAGIRLRHVIGPNTAHSYHPDSAAEVERSMDSIAEIGRDRHPTAVHLVTYTLKYNQMDWVTVEGISEHWERSAAEVVLADTSSLDVNTDNITDLAFDFPPGWCPLDVDQPVSAFWIIKRWSYRSHSATVRGTHSIWPMASGSREHGRKLACANAIICKAQSTTPSWTASYSSALRAKRHTTQPANGRAARSCAVNEWRRQFRGTPPVKNDSEVTDDDIAQANLVLWGDPSSNSILAKIADKLPITWKKNEIGVAGRSFPANRHALILIYPNPLNPNRYVVLNSGFTYREYAYLNNARQVPKLPDWAVIDLSTPPDALWPGKVAAAGFFDESWQLKPEED